MFYTKHHPPYIPVRNSLEQLILQSSLNFLLTQGAIKRCNLRIPSRKETPFPSPFQWQGWAMSATAQLMSTSRHTQLAGCKLYNSLTLVREVLPMGNLSFCPSSWGSFTSSWGSFPQREVGLQHNPLQASGPTVVAPKIWWKREDPKRDEGASPRGKRELLGEIWPQSRAGKYQQCLASGEGLLFATSQTSAQSRAWQRPLRTQTLLLRQVSPSHMQGMCLLKRKAFSNRQMLEEYKTSKSLYI